MLILNPARKLICVKTPFVLTTVRNVPNDIVCAKTMWLKLVED